MDGREIRKHFESCKDIFDLFALLAEAKDSCEIMRGARVQRDIESLERSIGYDKAKKFRTAIMSNPEEVPSAIYDIFPDGTYNLCDTDYFGRLMWITRTIDSLIGLRVISDNDKYEKYWQRLRSKHRFNGSGELGYVVPVPKPSMRSLMRGNARENIGDFSEYDNIMWIPCHIKIPSRGRERECNIRYIWMSSQEIRLHPDDLENIIFGFAPVLKNRDDIVFSRRASNRYTVEISPVDKRVCDRIVKEMAEEKVTIGILPELALAGESIRNLQMSLQENDHEYPKLVIAGSIDKKRGKFYNICCALGSNGKEIWAQNKLNGFSLTSDWIKKNKLEEQLELKDDEKTDSCFELEEDIETGPWNVTIADCFAGRIVIAICEDLNACAPIPAVSEKACVTVIISPVMDGDLKGKPGTTRWEARCASVLGRCVGISTSLVLPLRYAEVKNIECYPCNFGFIALPGRVPEYAQWTRENTSEVEIIKIDKS